MDRNLALTLAAGSGNSDAVDLLLESGADPNANNENGWSALMVATYSDRVKIIQQLLRRGANVRFIASDGQTALSVATKYNAEQALRLFAAEGLKP
jgi:ankyrin repeat protein